MTHTIEELKKLCDEATPGPWTIYRRDDLCGLIKYDVENDKMQQVCFGQYDNVFKNTKQTSEFIAASRTALPQLIEAYEKLQAENAKLNELLHDLNAVLKTAMHNGHHDLIQRVADVCKDEK